MVAIILVFNGCVVVYSVLENFSAGDKPFARLAAHTSFESGLEDSAFAHFLHRPFARRQVFLRRRVQVYVIGCC